MPKPHILVVGGGAAGLIAAGTAAENGASVTVAERNPRMARKVMITGKGRCNLTNCCDVATLIANVPRNPRFLYSAFNAFTPQDMMALIEAQGVPLKVERGNRVFPVSDKAVDVVDASSEGKRTDFAGAAELDAYLGDKLSRCEVVLEDSADVAHAWAFVTCSYQTSNSRTVVYAKEVEAWDSRPSE